MEHWRAVFVRRVLQETVPLARVCRELQVWTGRRQALLR
jgi:hypothetical protein